MLPHYAAHQLLSAHPATVGGSVGGPIGLPGSRAYMARPVRVADAGTV